VKAIRFAKDTAFGLASRFYGRDIGRGRGAPYGIVGIKAGLIPTEIAPFGGGERKAGSAARLSLRNR